MYPYQTSDTILTKCIGGFFYIFTTSFAKTKEEFFMAKRLMCIVLSFLMIMTVLPTGVAATSSVSLYGRSLSLGGKIGINYYFDFSSVGDASDYYVVFTFGSGSDATTQTVSSWTTDTIDGNTYYIATCRVYFYQMTDDITATIYNGSDESVAEFTGYSVYSYWTAVSNSPTYGVDSKLYDMVLGMLCYGTYGKIWTGRTLTNTESEALTTFTGGVAYYKTAFLSSSTTFGYTTDVSAEDNGISIAPTLVLDDSCDLKFVISGDSAADFTVTVDGETVAIQNDGDNYYVAITDILVQNWGTGHTIRVSYGDAYDEISDYSVMSYAYSMVSAAQAEGWEDTTENTKSLRNLLVGMYIYYATVNAYFAQ